MKKQKHNPNINKHTKEEPAIVTEKKVRQHYLACLLHSIHFAFYNHFCNSISDSLVVFTTHKILIYRGSFFTLDEMKLNHNI